jgi:hypothetical protein
VGGEYCVGHDWLPPDGVLGRGVIDGDGAAGRGAAGAGFGAAAAGFGAAVLRFAGRLRAFAFLAADFFAPPFFAATRFFLRAGAAFFAFFFDFFVLDFAFFAMIVLPIGSAQISVRLKRTALETKAFIPPPYPFTAPPRRAQAA